MRYAISSSVKALMQVPSLRSSFIARIEIHQTFWISRTIAYHLITEILDFSSSFDESPSKMLRFISFRAKNLESLPCLRDDLPFRLERSAKRQFGALSRSNVKSSGLYVRRRRERG
ncbi:hypothetical protein ACMZ76_06620 [Gardnerella vaginalis]